MTCAAAGPRPWVPGFQRQLRHRPQGGLFLTAVSVPHDVKVYPGAGHAFLNDYRDPLSMAMRMVGIGYHQPSAQHARRRIMAFLDTHLNSKPYLAPGGQEQDSRPLWFVAALLTFRLAYAAWSWLRPPRSRSRAAIGPGSCWWRPR